MRMIKGVEGPAGPPAELILERDALSGALLSVTASLAQGRDPEAVLHVMCDQLVAASPHLRLAWAYLGDPDVELIAPTYSAGPARDYAEYLGRGESPELRLGPIRRSLMTDHPNVSHIQFDGRTGSWRDRALQSRLRERACIPFGDADAASASRGVLVVYADEPDYFERIGLEPFFAFARLAEMALQQAHLRLRLQELATVDHLTGLLNRGALQEVLEREHARAQRSERPYCMLLFDLDRFKLINDSYGHAVGDQVLAAVAARAQDVLREGDWLGRWGGEEFLCLLPETDHHEGYLVAERLRLGIGETPVAADERKLDITVSVGLANFRRDGDSLTDLLTCADAALYEAKRGGRNRLVSSNGRAQGIFFIGGQVEEALKTDRVRPVYQPIVDLASGAVVADESLARIVTADNELLEAREFIEAASQLQLIHRIDYQVMLQTMRHCMSVAALGQKRMHFVNVSADLLRHPELVERLLEQARLYCACVNGDEQDKPLVIEITERELLEDTAHARRVLTPFLDFGLRLAIDDFGSGYSSFQYLADLPVAFLKIEGDLVRRVAREPRVRAILHGIQDTSRTLGLTTLAESVEDAQTMEVLKEIGVDWGQGYYFGRPQAADAANDSVPAAADSA